MGDRPGDRVWDQTETETETETDKAEIILLPWLGAERLSSLVLMITG